MEWKIELVFIPVTDVDRAKSFYVDQVGFAADFDERVSDTLRFVQLTPPGSACSIYLGEGLNDMAPGSQQGLQMVVANADNTLAALTDNGVQATGVVDLDWGRFVYFADPDGNTWSVQELPARAAVAE